jgi:Coenzyme PQQ synthesis protein D (PqqD)
MKYHNGEREHAMIRARHFKVDQHRIVHETIEGEAILIDLNTGTYYSLRGSGPEVWALLVDGHSDEDVVRLMRARGPADADAVATETADLIDRLCEERLLEESEMDHEPHASSEADAASDEPFESPVLERYTDMQHFLLLDPVHEVANVGWPSPPEAEQAPARSG